MNDYESRLGILFRHENEQVYLCGFVLVQTQRRRLSFYSDANVIRIHSVQTSGGYANVNLKMMATERSNIALGSICLSPHEQFVWAYIVSYEEKKGF